LPAELPIAAIAPREWLFTNHQRQAVCNAYSMVGTTANGGGVVAFILHIDGRYNGDERREARGYKREERKRKGDRICYNPPTLCFARRSLLSPVLPFMGRFNHCLGRPPPGLLHLLNRYPRARHRQWPEVRRAG
jgi:hypothetical protein